MSKTIAWREAEAALEAKVAKLKADGVDPVERAAITADDRKALLMARSAAFGHATQGKGKPMSYPAAKERQR